MAAFVWSVPGLAFEGAALPGAGLLDGCWAEPEIETMSSTTLEEIIERQMREMRLLAIIPVHSLTW
ncbi:MAG TPA: hypothetical protein VMH03_09860 [Terriglobales bacterium]|nr:hypothetical protein [Terriglobales bacterium]